MSLKKGFLKQQFGLFCWVHMTLLLIVVSRYESISRVFEYPSYGFPATSS
jgi:phosphatidate cytidylyltransferase